jgi:fibro-slime domain-containing protein
VSPQLDSDGKPAVSLGGPSSSPQRTISSDASFRTWFRDTPCQNLPLPRVLTVFRTASYGHTPQDPRWAYGVGDGSLGMSWNRGYNDTHEFVGNGSYGVNLSWTMEFECNFTYREDKAQWLHVSAACDVWVYLDGGLVIDVNGGSQPAFGAVDLNSVKTRLGLVDGKPYKFKIFVANRYAATQPRFTVWFNFPIKQTGQPDILAFRHLEDIKRVRNDVAERFRVGGYAALSEAAVPARPHILGFGTDLAASSTGTTQ